MQIQEIAFRTRQEVLKRLERIGGASLRSIPPTLDIPMPRESLREYLLGRRMERFFPGAVDDHTATLTATLSGYRDRTMSAAEAIIQKRFALLGHRDLHFGDRVDWHFDPVLQKRSPLLHWSRLDPLDSSVCGDVKLVWELNRHQWLLPLGQAYRLTGDHRYAHAFESLVCDWLAANPTGLGINWTSSLEVSLRLISWCWALFLFVQSRVMTPDFSRRLLTAICAHASHVERYLSYYWSPNTHLTGEALGLFYAGLLFPEMPRAERWRACGTRILIEECNRQVLSDGVYFEQSTYYQRYTVETYLHFLILAHRGGLHVPTRVGESVQRMLDFLLAVRSPDGSMPQMGDADSGRLLPLDRRPADDYGDLFSTAAVVFSRADYAWAARDLAPETLWLLGPAAVDAFRTLRPEPPRTAPSRLFQDGGYAVMRNSWEPTAHHLVFDIGSLNPNVMENSHGHADFLSIQCSPFGHPYLVDGGTYSYSARPLWRDFFRGTGAHTTIIVDGLGQAIPAGPFAWKSWPRARLRRWLSTPTFDFADASHDAYLRLLDPVTHRRRVLFVKPRYWIVLDELQGGESHAVEARFQFAPINVTLDGNSWCRATDSSNRGLLVRAFVREPVDMRLVEGEVSPFRGWISPEFGRSQPAPMLICSTEAFLPLRIITVIIPISEPLADPPTILPLEAGSTGPNGLTFLDSRERVYFTDDDFAVEQL